MTVNTSLHKGRDPRYLTAGADGGHVGGMRYYTEAAGEPPGRWAGRGAAGLGLAGDVDADVLQALYVDRVGPDGVRLDARAQARFRPVKEREDLAVAAHLSVHPLAAEGELAEVRAADRATSRHATPYFDFTVSAAKSVSVLHASYLVAARQLHEAGADDRARDLERQASAITDALLASARAAVARVERALYVRTGYHSATSGEYRDAAGATVAMFLQHTSREGDPQLHVHLAVMNLAQRQDGADLAALGDHQARPGGPGPRGRGRRARHRAGRPGRGLRPLGGRHVRRTARGRAGPVRAGDAGQDRRAGRSRGRGRDGYRGRVH